MNLTGTFNVTHVFANALREDGSAVVNTASMAGRYGVAGIGPDSAARADVADLTRVLASEWAGDDARVDAVNPGFIATPPVVEMLELDEIPDREPVEFEFFDFDLVFFLV